MADEISKICYSVSSNVFMYLRDYRDLDYKGKACKKWRWASYLHTLDEEVVIAMSQVLNEDPEE